MVSYRFFESLIISVLTCIASAQAEKVLTIGVPPWPELTNFVQDGGSAPVASVYQQLTQSGVLSERVAGDEIVGIRGLAFNSDAEVAVTVAKGAKFSNGANVSVQAIEEGINSCPVALQNGVHASATKSQKVIISLTRETPDPRYVLLNVLRSCPISDPSVMRALGSDYGVGTNSVGLGYYFASAYKPGRSVSFQTSKSTRARSQGFERIEVRAIDSASSGLAALRLGNIELAIPNDRGVLEEAARDTTLTVGRCGAFEYVARASLIVPCVGERLLFSEVRNG